MPPFSVTSSARFTVTFPERTAFAPNETPAPSSSRSQEMGPSIVTPAPSSARTVTVPDPAMAEEMTSMPCFEWISGVPEEENVMVPPESATPPGFSLTIPPTVAVPWSAAAMPPACQEKTTVLSAPSGDEAWSQFAASVQLPDALPVHV